MSQLVLARGNNYHRGLLKKFFPNLQFGPYFLIMSLIIFVVLVTVITLMFSTRQVTKGYVLNKMETRHQDLVKELEQKEMQISQARSLNFIEQSSKVRYMVDPGEIVFIGAETALASR